MQRGELCSSISDMKGKIGVGMGEGISPVVFHEGQGWGWDGDLPCSSCHEGQGWGWDGDLPCSLP
jgi:hypothetical protein